MKPHTRIATLLGMDSKDVYEGRYQSTDTKTAIYVIGDDYYAVGKSKPRDEVGGPWIVIGSVDGVAVWEAKFIGEQGREYSNNSTT